MRVCKRFSFDAAHYLPGYDGKCANMHGHRWMLDVEVEGPVGSNGMVIDFGELKELVGSKVINRLDHQVLNDIMGMPTAECLILWVWERLSNFEAPWRLARLRLYESPESFAEVRLADAIMEPR